MSKQQDVLLRVLLYTPKTLQGMHRLTFELTRGTERQQRQQPPASEQPNITLGRKT